MFKKNLYIVLFSFSFMIAQDDHDHDHFDDYHDRYDDFKGGFITGMVVNSSTNLPIDYVVIKFTSVKDSSIISGTSTNDGGIFELRGVQPGIYNVEISFPGYKMYLNSIQAQIILNNFKTFEEKMKRLENIVDIYNRELGYDNTSLHLYRIKVTDNQKFINSDVFYFTS